MHDQNFWLSCPSQAVGPRQEHHGVAFGSRQVACGTRCFVRDKSHSEGLRELYLLPTFWLCRNKIPCGSL